MSDISVIRQKVERSRINVRSIAELNSDAAFPRIYQDLSLIYQTVIDEVDENRLSVRIFELGTIQFTVSKKDDWEFDLSVKEANGDEGYITVTMSQDEVERVFFSGYITENALGIARFLRDYMGDAPDMSGSMLSRLMNHIRVSECYIPQEYAVILREFGYRVEISNEGRNLKAVKENTDTGPVYLTMFADKGVVTVGGNNFGIAGRHHAGMSFSLPYKDRHLYALLNFVADCEKPMVLHQKETTNRLTR